MKEYYNISETAKHTSELRLDSNIKYKKQFYCPTVLRIDEIYRYFYSQYCEVRFKLINQIIDELKPDIVIEFASGLSPRGLIIAEKSRKLLYVDTDLSGINKYKQKIFQGNTIKHPDNLIIKRFDLLTDNMHNLRKFVNVDGKKVVFLTEGLLPYLDYKELRNVLSGLTGLVNNRNQFFWISDINIKYSKLSKGEESVLLALTKTKKNIEKEINWKILNYPFLSNNHFVKFITNDPRYSRRNIKFYKMKDYKGTLRSKRILKNLIENTNIKNSADKLLAKKVRIFKIRLECQNQET